MAVKIKKGNALASLSITPLIDVVFLLLIFFLVATRFEKEDRELDVLLPNAADAKPLIAKPTLTFVSIDEQGRYYLEGEILSLAQLKEALVQKTVDDITNQSVVLRADQRCDWGNVAAALDACHAAESRCVPRRPPRSVQAETRAREIEQDCVGYASA